MGIDEGPKPGSPNIRPMEKQYIDQWAQNRRLDPDIINNDYYILANALDALKKGTAPENSGSLPTYRERQKIVSGYTDEEVEYLVSKSDPGMVAEYDDIIQTFAQEEENIYRTRDISKLQSLVDRMRELVGSNHK